ncbi:hypothetical protein AB3K78_03240 [Leucobacter sp. HNU]|uniref:hypothetical protein n=1 Tax=Leucobacter sp. HNU TaxID=3236805 RepID=UPI003A80EC69
MTSSTFASWALCAARSTASRSANTGAARRAIASAASVGRVLRAVRSKSGSPAAASSAAICWDTAEAV